MSLGIFLARMRALRFKALLLLSLTFVGIGSCRAALCHRQDIPISSPIDPAISSWEKLDYGVFSCNAGYTDYTAAPVSEPILFKSVKCTSDPGLDLLKSAVDTGSQPHGYCTKLDPNLQLYQSNQEFCSSGADSNICALFQWRLTGPGTYSWAGKPDYGNNQMIAYVDGEEAIRANMREFQITVSSGTHTVSVYAREPCCAGRRPGWTGWMVKAIDACALSGFCKSCPTGYYCGGGGS